MKNITARCWLHLTSPASTSYLNKLTELVYIGRLLIAKLGVQLCTTGHVHGPGLIPLAPSKQLLLMQLLPIANLLQPLNIRPLNF